MRFGLSLADTCYDPHAASSAPAGPGAMGSGREGEQIAAHDIHQREF